MLTFQINTYFADICSKSRNTVMGDLKSLENYKGGSEESLLNADELSRGYKGLTEDVVSLTEIEDVVETVDDLLQYIDTEYYSAAYAALRLKCIMEEGYNLDRVITLAISGDIVAENQIKQLILEEEEVSEIIKFRLLGKSID